MLAPAPFLWLKKPPQLPARSGFRQIGPLVDREFRREDHARVTQRQDNQCARCQQPGKVVSVLRQEKKYRRLKDGEGGKNQPAGSQSRVQRKDRRAGEPQERQNEDRRHRLQNEMRPVDENKDTERARQKYRKNLPMRFPSPTGSSKVWIGQVGERVRCQPNLQKCRREQHTANEAVLPCARSERASDGSSDSVVMGAI
jgi:hypothetical protein